MALLISLGACGGARTAAPRTDAADLVLYNGDIRTLDPKYPHASMIAVRGDKIIAVGEREALHAVPTGPSTRFVDLAGRTAIPGLVDAHCHLYELGTDLESVSVRSTGSEAAVVELVAAAAKTRPAAEWLVGRGWDQNLWAAKSFPTRASLDAISDRPVMLERVDGHAIWVNSKALALAGITAATPDPAGGKIVRDARGEPTGVLVDNATALVAAKLPAATREVRERRIRAAADKAIAAGITGVHEMGIEDATADVYRELARQGALPLRVYAYLAGDPAHPDALRTRSPEAPVGWFALRGVKFFADGALGSRGARLRADYDDEPGSRGLWVTEPAVLARAVEAAVAGGWQVAIHAIGDAGVGSVLDAYLAAEQSHPGDLRLRVEHTQVIAADDVDRMVRARAIASMQPTHATSDMPWAEARIGKDRIRGAYAWRTMLEHGIPLAFGSDFPVEQVSPVLGIYAAVTRQDRAGNPPGGWYPAQRMTIDEAIAGFTTGAAYAEGAEQHRGRLAPGFDADVTVFAGQLTDARSLLDLGVLGTIVGGRAMYGADHLRGTNHAPFAPLDPGWTR